MKQPLMNLFISYDNAGFTEAVRLSDPEPFPIYLHQAMLEHLIRDGLHDMSIGGCETFEIYNEDGQIVYQGKKSQEKTA